MAARACPLGTGREGRICRSSGRGHRAVDDAELRRLITGGMMTRTAEAGGHRRVRSGVLELHDCVRIAVECMEKRKGGYEGIEDGFCIRYRYIVPLRRRKLDTKLKRQVRNQ
jgi:hypothetical protein